MAVIVAQYTLNNQLRLFTRDITAPIQRKRQDEVYIIARRGLRLWLEKLCEDTSAYDEGCLIMRRAIAKISESIARRIKGVSNSQ